MVTDTSLGIKHAFVTGATGIVGVPLCRALVDSGVRVTAFSRSPVKRGLPSAVQHMIGSILDVDSLSEAATDADVIFHVAAAVHGSATSHGEYERANIEGTANVIRVARNIGAKLVHVSSVNVAGYRKGELKDSYAETKSKGEELIAEALGSGLKTVIVRPATVFGNEPGRAGILVDRLLSGSLKVLPAPSRVISPVWSGDLAKALMRAAEVGQAGETYTVAGPQISTGEFVKLICSSAGVRQPLISIPGWIFALPLQLALWTKVGTRWVPPVSVESLLHGSAHDGAKSARELGYEHTPIARIFGG